MREIKLIEEDVHIGSIFKNVKDDEKFAEQTLHNLFDYVVDSSGDDDETTEYYMKELGIAVAIFHNDGDNFEKFWEHLLNTSVFHDGEGKVTNYDADYDSFEVMYQY